jgi:hypothetical protein
MSASFLQSLPWLSRAMGHRYKLSSLCFVTQGSQEPLGGNVWWKFHLLCINVYKHARHLPWSPNAIWHEYNWSSVCCVIQGSQGPRGCTLNLISNVQSYVWRKVHLVWWGFPKTFGENAYEGDSGYTGVNLSNICGAKVEQLLHR